MDKESAILVLRTSNGTANALRNEISWDVNMTEVLSQDWLQKYSRFKICLSSMGMQTSGTGWSNNDLVFGVYMKGLPWQNGSYKVSTATTTNETLLTVYQMAANAVSALLLTGENGTVFHNTFSGVNTTITIRYEKLDTGISATQTYPHAMFAFAIYGLE